MNSFIGDYNMKMNFSKFCSNKLRKMDGLKCNLLDVCIMGRNELNQRAKSNEDLTFTTEFSVFLVILSYVCMKLWYDDWWLYVWRNEENKRTFDALDGLTLNLTLFETFVSAHSKWTQNKNRCTYTYCSYFTNKAERTLSLTYNAVPNGTFERKQRSRYFKQFSSEIPNNCELSMRRDNNQGIFRNDQKLSSSFTVKRYFYDRISRKSKRSSHLAFVCFEMAASGIGKQATTEQLKRRHLTNGSGWCHSIEPLWNIIKLSRLIRLIEDKVINSYSSYFFAGCQCWCFRLLCDKSQELLSNPSTELPTLEMGNKEVHSSIT